MALGRSFVPSVASSILQAKIGRVPPKTPYLW